MVALVVILLVLVLCLAAIGISYSKWTDSITMEGTVTTSDNFDSTTDVPYCPPPQGGG